MNRVLGCTVLPGILISVILFFVVVLLLVKILWAWTIPDLFPGAVEQGLVAGSISWFSAVKLGIFVAVLAAISGARKQNRS